MDLSEMPKEYKISLLAFWTGLTLLPIICGIYASVPFWGWRLDTWGVVSLGLVVLFIGILHAISFGLLSHKSRPLLIGNITLVLYLALANGAINIGEFRFSPHALFLSGALVLFTYIMARGSWGPLRQGLITGVLTGASALLAGVMTNPQMPLRVLPIALIAAVLAFPVACWLVPFTNKKAPKTWQTAIPAVGTILLLFCALVVGTGAGPFQVLAGIVFVIGCLIIGLAILPVSMFVPGILSNTPQTSITTGDKVLLFSRPIMLWAFIVLLVLELWV